MFSVFSINFQQLSVWIYLFKVIFLLRLDSLASFVIKFPRADLASKITAKVLNSGVVIYMP